MTQRLDSVAIIAQSRPQRTALEAGGILSEGPAMAMRTCAITGKEFDDEKSGYKWNYEGKWYYFADIAARNKFIGDPKKHIEAATSA